MSRNAEATASIKPMSDMLGLSHARPVGVSARAARPVASVRFRQLANILNAECDLGPLSVAGIVPLGSSRVQFVIDAFAAALVLPLGPSCHPLRH